MTTNINNLWTIMKTINPQYLVHRISLCYEHCNNGALLFFPLNVESVSRI
jgi:hypothetical protein